MATNLEIIETALRDINVIAETESASAEQGQTGIRKLNQMMALWKISSKDLGYFAQSDTTATIPIPDWAEAGVAASLGLFLAPKYGATISIEDAAIITASENAITRTVIVNRQTNTDMTHLPIGAGHFYGDRRNILTGG